MHTVDDISQTTVTKACGRRRPWWPRRHGRSTAIDFMTSLPSTLFPNKCITTHYLPLKPCFFAHPLPPIPAFSNDMSYSRVGVVTGQNKDIGLAIGTSCPLAIRFIAFSLTSLISNFSQYRILLFSTQSHHSITAVC